MSHSDDTRARDAAHADAVLREICASFRSDLEVAASGAVARRYAAVPSWYATGSTVSRPCRPYPPVPSWCIDATTARRLLDEEDSR
jgi:hypothetical protein